VVLALAALRRIPRGAPGAEITALTTPAYKALLEASPYVDRVDPEGRPKGLTATLAMLRRLGGSVTTGLRSADILPQRRLFPGASTHSAALVGNGAGLRPAASQP
jgi:hypothetical protein